MPGEICEMKAIDNEQSAADTTIISGTTCEVIYDTSDSYRSMELEQNLNQSSSSKLERPDLVRLELKRTQASSALGS